MRWTLGVIGACVLAGVVIDMVWIHTATVQYDLVGLGVALPPWLGIAIAGSIVGVGGITWLDRKAGGLDVAEVGIILDPSDPAEYNQMYDGFRHCEYMAYNAPFKVEGGPGDTVFDAAVETHRQRYARGVRAKYLFFDQASLDRAVAFFGKLAAAGVPVHDHVQLALHPTADTTVTFFTGKRPTGFLKQVPEGLGRSFDTTVVVMYPEELNESGYPEAAVVIEGASSLYKIMRRRFLKAWSEASAVALDRPATPSRTFQVEPAS